MMSLAQLAERLGGDVAGGQVVCPGPNHSPQDRSLSVRPIGDRFIVFSFAGDPWPDCSRHVRRKLGEIAPSRVQTMPKSDPQYARRQREKAAWLWSQRRSLAGSIAEKYLREARGITSPLPATLGFLLPRKREQHPALIGAFGLCDEPEPGALRAPQDVGAIHLTLLKPDGSGKADIQPSKLIIGSPRGKPLVLAPPNDLLGLAVCEGIETGLSIHAATGLGVWAAGAAGFMPALADTVPAHIECVTIYQEADQAGRQHTQNLARALVERGRALEVLIAETPHEPRRE